MHQRFRCWIFAALLAARALDARAASTAAPPASPDFARDIRPILSDKCFHCHGPDEKQRKAGLRLDTEAGAKALNKEGKAAIVPGKPEQSQLIARLTTKDAADVMPPTKLNKPVTPEQVELFRRWISQGARWAGHWAYQKPVRPALPPLAASFEKSARNPIDHFILQRLEKEKLRPSPEADRYALARRVALDLTGLPPTLAEADAFAKDVSPDAYEKFVDQLLKKPAFGEHWARMWLDLARYADSAGYADDPPRVIWAFRDYVINAFNRNLPFDRFTIEQLAGDLLDNPTEEQLMATAFHRNTMTNNEGGTNDEEWRNAAVIDRVNTTWAVWMGSSFNCAQCHTHKYDPFSQKEYYQFFAFLNQTADSDKRDESPVFEFFTSEQKARKSSLESEQKDLDEKFSKPVPAWLAGLEKWQAAFPAKLQWQAAKSASANSKGGAAITTRDDGALVVAKGQAKDTYSVELPLSAGKLSAVRIEALQDKSLAAEGPGHGAKGKFTITHVAAVAKAPSNATAKGRFVRIELPKPNGRHLQLAEVQVFSGTENVARKGEAKQSSTGFGGEAKRAIDGNTNGDYFKSNSVTHTATGDNDPWWEVDLKSEFAIDRVVIWNRTDGRPEDLKNFRVRVLDEKRGTAFEKTIAELPKPSVDAGPGGATSIQFAAAIASAGSGAESVLDAKDKAKGWSHSGGGASLTLVLDKPLEIADGTRLTLTIEQDAKEKNATLGCFRVHTTGDSGAAQQARTPANVITALAAAAPSDAQRATIRDHYVRAVAPEAKTERARLAAVSKELTDLKPNTVPVFRDLAGKDRRTTKIQIRGNWQDLGDEVREAVPASMPALAADAPRNRLTLAKWIVDEQNPLTARVIANRFWEQIFGTGIVRTSEEFGSQGELPSHPELLDWLATELVRVKWNVKAFLKTVVTSATYRQSSRVTDELRERDPDNRLLARGPRVRMPAEMIRDQALAAGGLLSPKMLGPSVRPPRPVLGLNAAFGRNMDWETSAGEDRYRRALYTEARRTSPYPSMATFDAPNREVCTIRRSRTNTPLQALVTLNDPVYIEAAQALARRMARDGGATANTKAAHGFRLCLTRPPTDTELARLVKLHADSRAIFEKDADAAAKMATEPLGALPKEMNAADLAAWTVVANVILNLDEVVMKK